LESEGGEGGHLFYSTEKQNCGSNGLTRIEEEIEKEVKEKNPASRLGALEQTKKKGNSQGEEVARKEKYQGRRKGSQRRSHYVNPSSLGQATQPKRSGRNMSRAGEIGGEKDSPCRVGKKTKKGAEGGLTGSQRGV